MGPELVAANLRRLREQRGLSQDALAEAAGISRLGYRNIETRKSAPRVDTLQSLAEALGVSLSELVAPMPHLRYVRFRSLKRLNSREQVLADIARRLGDYNQLEETLGQVGAPPKRPRRTRPTEMARIVRREFGLDPKDAVRDICGLLESRGYKVLLVSVASDSFFGLSVSEKDGGPAVVVNTWERISVERQIFSAAHELGHLLLHPDAYDVRPTEEVEAEEKEADEFASYFLMSPELFKKEWEDTSGHPFFRRVLKVKRIFSVSYKTVLYRLRETNPGANYFAIFQSQHRGAFGATLTRTEEPEPADGSAFHSPEPMKSREPDEMSPNAFLGDRLHRLVRTAFEKELISESRAAEILDISIKDMRRLSASWLT